MIEGRDRPYFHARMELVKLMKSTPFNKEDGIFHYQQYFFKEVKSHEQFEDDVIDMLESFDSKITHALSFYESNGYSEAEADEIRALKIDLSREIEESLDIVIKNNDIRTIRAGAKALKNLCQRLYELFLLDETLKKYLYCPLPRANFPVVTNLVQKLRKESQVYPHVWNTMKQEYNIESPLSEYLRERERIHKTYLRFQ